MQEPGESLTSAPRKFQATCADARRDLESAISTLRAWGVSVSPDSRLFAAQELLARLAEAGTFPTVRHESRRAVNALLAAQDFAEIAGRLPPNRVAEVRKELQVAVDRGSLDQDEDENERQPYQYQGQHWIGTVLHIAGLNPTLPRVRRGKSPDYLVENGTRRYGIEVKRPASERSISRRLEHAVEQLAGFDVFGAVVLDLTDCMADTEPSVFLPEGERLGNVADAIVWDSVRERHQPGFERIIMMTVVLRGAWGIRNTTPTRIQFFNASASSVFVAASGSLLDHHACWLRKSLQSGLFRPGTLIEERRRL